MAFEEHKNRKFQFGNPYEDFEYVGKHSRLTWPSLVFFLLIGAGFCYLAWHRWHEINMAELMGGTISVTTIEWALYKISGKWGVASILLLFGIGMALLGIYNYNRLEKMKQAAD
jgi:uncharacterized membrane protein YjjP (DUF1212 family)